MNPDRLIIGIATCFGVRAHGGTYWHREQFHDFVRLEIGIPVRVDHAPLIDHRGVVLDVDVARRFAMIEKPVDGLLALCEISNGAWGDRLLEDILLHQREGPWLPGWGMSIGARVLPGEIALPFELSLTTQPGFADARVLGVGPDALRTWQFLIEENEMIKGAGAPDN
jgi:hypothetical protein